MLILGEVHTGLLQSSACLEQPDCEQLLQLLPGERVRRSERPIAYAVSPDLLNGIDCRLPTLSGPVVRGVGTVRHRAAITGGRVLQGSALVHLTGSTANRRLPWSHYLTRPGYVEAIGKADWSALARGFVATPNGSAAGGVGTGLLNLGAISGRVMDRVQAAPDLDRRPPFRAARTRLRWAALTTGDSADISFTIEDRQLRTLHLVCDQEQAASIAALCEDLALHDWLLTTLVGMIARSRLDSGPPPQAISRLRPAIDQLLHLWMPAARVDHSVGELWQRLERRPGFSRQWQASVNRIRDHIALHTMTLLGTDTAGPGGGRVP